MAFRPDVATTPQFDVESIDGGVTSGDGTLEAVSIHIPGRRDGILIIVARQSLDIQYTVGVATGVPTIFITVGENNSDGVDGFIDIINALNAESAPPQVSWLGSCSPVMM